MCSLLLSVGTLFLALGVNKLAGIPQGEVTGYPTISPNNEFTYPSVKTLITHYLSVTTYPSVGPSTTAKQPITDYLKVIPSKAFTYLSPSPSTIAKPIIIGYPKVTASKQLTYPSPSASTTSSPIETGYQKVTPSKGFTYPSPTASTTAKLYITEYPKVTANKQLTYPLPLASTTPRPFKTGYQKVTSSNEFTYSSPTPTTVFKPTRYQSTTPRTSLNPLITGYPKITPSNQFIYPSAKPSTTIRPLTTRYPSSTPTTTLRLLKTGYPKFIPSNQFTYPSSAPSTIYKPIVTGYSKVSPKPASEITTSPLIKYFSKVTPSIPYPYSSHSLCTSKALTTGYTKMTPTKEFTFSTSKPIITGYPEVTHSIPITYPSSTHSTHKSIPSGYPKATHRSPTPSTPKPLATGYPIPFTYSTTAKPDVSEYPRIFPQNPFIYSSSFGKFNLQDESVLQSSVARRRVSRSPATEPASESHDDGRYRYDEDHTHWDIRKSVPGEPGKDYPVLPSIPATTFSCSGRPEGYFADQETGCQVFHVCTEGAGKAKSSFLCPNGSIFSQKLFTCDWWNNVNCTASEVQHNLNFDLFQSSNSSSSLFIVTDLKGSSAVTAKPYLNSGGNVVPTDAVFPPANISDALQHIYGGTVTSGNTDSYSNLFLSSTRVNGKPQTNSGGSIINHREYLPPSTINIIPEQNIVGNVVDSSLLQGPLEVNASSLCNSGGNSCNKQTYLPPFNINAVLPEDPMATVSGSKLFLDTGLHGSSEVTTAPQTIFEGNAVSIKSYLPYDEPTTQNPAFSIKLSTTLLPPLGTTEVEKLTVNTNSGSQSYSEQKYDNLYKSFPLGGDSFTPSNISPNEVPDISSPEPHINVEIVLATHVNNIPSERQEYTHSTPTSVYNYNSDLNNSPEVNKVSTSPEVNINYGNVISTVPNEYVSAQVNSFVSSTNPSTLDYEYIVPQEPASTETSPSLLSKNKVEPNDADVLTFISNEMLKTLEEIPETVPSHMPTVDREYLLPQTHTTEGSVLHNKQTISQSIPGGITPNQLRTSSDGERNEAEISPLITFSSQKNEDEDENTLLNERFGFYPEEQKPDLPEQRNKSTQNVEIETNSKSIYMAGSKAKTQSTLTDTYPPRGSLPQHNSDTPSQPKLEISLEGHEKLPVPLLTLPEKQYLRTFEPRFSEQLLNTYNHNGGTQTLIQPTQFQTSQNLRTLYQPVAEKTFDFELIKSVSLTDHTGSHNLAVQAPTPYKPLHSYNLRTSNIGSLFSQSDQEKMIQSVPLLATSDKYSYNSDVQHPIQSAGFRSPYNLRNTNFEEISSVPELIPSVSFNFNTLEGQHEFARAVAAGVLGDRLDQPHLGVSMSQASQQGYYNNNPNTPLAYGSPPAHSY